MIHDFFRLLRSPSYVLALLVALTCIVLQFAGLTDQLAYQRSLIASGQIGLLLSGNFVHLGDGHLWMNMAGLVLVVALVWSHFSVWQWLTLILHCSLVVGLGLWFFNPEVEAYVGFSGTLHGLIIAGTLADLRRYPKSAAMLLVLVVGKLIWEQLAGALPGSASAAGGPILVDAHLYGAIGGAMLVPLLLLQNRRQRASESPKSITP